jgi:hypothetical protein
VRYWGFFQVFLVFHPNEDGHKLIAERTFVDIESIFKENTVSARYLLPFIVSVVFQRNQPGFNDYPTSMTDIDSIV